LISPTDKMGGILLFT